ncbi:uncharacterized protein LOC100893269 [Strongylocentrotus purpuratus]|uniref:Ubiquitin-like domain-containing protein n=1 Tax=Strongylocentrotus purpuratus TaxID=7668 RepID=A0A7M7LSF4_STRPU|nr:uncharacterized protein LOC100893269 [Strongylocentrotus purpuratus]|eukprot:XP_011660484.1 PREDICTED: uncharacterized protein LOC100893269 [Strongylocentrotus purpuratus]
MTQRQPQSLSSHTLTPGSSDAYIYAETKPRQPRTAPVQPGQSPWAWTGFVARSRECQINDWPTHKLECSPKDRSTRGHHEETEAVGTETVNLQTLTLDEQTCKDDEQTLKKLGNGELLTDSAYESRAEQQEKVLQPGGRTESGSSTSTVDSIRDPVTITIKMSKQKHRVTLGRQSTGTSLMADISRAACIPLEQMKLIHKGKLMNPDNIHESLTDRAVFQAIGEVAENDEGLSGKDITCVMDQMKVDRNTAIKALRNTKNAIDAILYLGNK